MDLVVAPIEAIFLFNQHNIIQLIYRCILTPYNIDKWLSFPQLLLTCRHNNIFSDHSGMLLFPGSHYHRACGIVEIHFVLIAVVVFGEHELVQFHIFNHSRAHLWHANTTYYILCVLLLSSAISTWHWKVALNPETRKRLLDETNNSFSLQ